MPERVCVCVYLLLHAQQVYPRLKACLIRVLDLFLLFAHFPFFYLTRIPATISGIFQANTHNTHTHSKLSPSESRVEPDVGWSIERESERERLSYWKHLRRRSPCWKSESTACVCVRVFTSSFRWCFVCALSVILQQLLANDFVYRFQGQHLKCSRH